MAKKDKRFITAEDLYNIKEVENPQWSPDGRQVAFVRLEIIKRLNAYRRTIWRWQADWGESRQFTNGGLDKLDFFPRYDPNGDRLAFLSTRNEKPQIYLIRTDGGEATIKTTRPNGVKGFSWSPDGKTIAFISPMSVEEIKAEDKGKYPLPLPEDKYENDIRKIEKERQEQEQTDPRLFTGLPFKVGTAFTPQRYNHIYLLAVDAEDANPRRLTQGEVDYGLPQWSPDGKTLWSWVARQPTENRYAETDLVKISVEDGEVERLTREGYFACTPIPSPDGEWIACESTLDVSPYGHIPRLTVLRPDGSEWRDLNLEIDRTVGAHGDAYQVRWAADGNGLYLILDDRGDSDLYYCDVETANFVHLVKGGEVVLEFDVNREGEFAYSATTPERPADLYTTGTAGENPTRRSDFNKDFLEEVHVATTEEIIYKAPDGKRIQGWIIKPPDFNPKEKWPLALNVHGGPHVMWSHSTPSMWIEWQLHAARGYVVFYCNPRGSDGYGENYRYTIHDEWGEADMPDILAGVDAVVEQGYIDKKHMAITGGSYGGFMTVWIVGHDKRFAAAVSQRGVYQLLSFYGTTDIPFLIEGEFEVMAFDDPNKMWRYSPLAYVRNIKTPLLLIHSDNDYRVPISDAEQLFTALKKLGRKVEFVRYPRDGHELSRSGEPKHRVDRLERMTAWFDKYCKPRKV
jgi:dipeptidyl aminopeptidase/acylaminoacyl peptidase